MSSNILEEARKISDCLRNLLLDPAHLWAPLDKFYGNLLSCLSHLSKYNHTKGSPVDILELHGQGLKIIKVNFGQCAGYIDDEWQSRAGNTSRRTR